MERIEDLIYDWNVDAGRAAPSGKVEFDDETLRYGLQSPSVKDPLIEQKLELLHLMDSLGIHTADIGLPGAGGRPREAILRLAREIAEIGMRIKPNVAAEAGCPQRSPRSALAAWRRSRRSPPAAPGRA